MIDSIDTLIAEKIMGYKIIKGRSHYDGLDMPWEIWIDGNEKMNPIAYSSKIEFAWLVVEKIKTLRFSIRNKFINAVQDLTTPNEFKESGDRISSGWTLFFINPEIICRAALKAIE